MVFIYLEKLRECLGRYHGDIWRPKRFFWDAIADLSASSFSPWKAISHVSPYFFLLVLIYLEKLQ